MLASEIIPFIRTMTPEGYYGGPIPTNKPARKVGLLWEFGICVYGQQVYIKLQTGAPEAAIICVFFHCSERPLSFPHESV